jgi:hypothetical protein
VRRPHLSTGAWIFAGIVTAAIIAPIGVYAAATSTTAIGNISNATTATVTSQHQLLTSQIAPNNVVHVFVGFGGDFCTSVYTPPAGKAIVVTEVNWDIGSGTAGTEAYAELATSDCAQYYDIADTTQGFDDPRFTYTTGLPLPSVGVRNGTTAYGGVVEITGYLVPASHLPASTPQVHLPARLREAKAPIARR